MLQPFETQLAAAWPPDHWVDTTVLAAVSGGADSVALLRALHRLKTSGVGRLCVAHFNHRLRTDSNNDERFVVELCGRLNVACEVGHAEAGTLAVSAPDGIEAAARTARYAFFEQAAGRLGARFVATAHSADDQAETILHRIVRGTGVRGLAGMARVRPLGHATLIRPMLHCHRSQVVAYLKAIDQPWRDDSSNTSLEFTRNRIRHETMPLLRAQFNPGVADALLRLGGLAGEAQQVLDDLVADLFERCVAVDNRSSVRIRLEPLATRRPYLVRELLSTIWRRQAWPMQAMGRVKWDELSLMALHGLPGEKRVLPGHVVTEIVGREMHLSRVSDTD